MYPLTLFRTKFEFMGKDKHLGPVKRIKDNPLVYCLDMDFERAVKIFKSKFQRSYTIAILKQRRNNASRADRLRAKRYRALNRLKKRERMK